MIFDFKNLGPIESAKIELKGLTIITGLNDTGKSFISKSIYSIIKTVNDSSAQSIAEKYESISNYINQIFSLHRQIIPFTQLKLSEFNPHEITRKILVLLENEAPSKEITDLIIDYTKRVIADIKTVNRPLIDNHINRIQGLSDSTLLLVVDSIEEEKKFKTFFDKIVIQKLFQGQLNNLLKKDSILSIKVTEGATDVLDISVKENRTQSFNLLNLLLIEDATLIETPTIIQLAKFITTTLAFPSALKKVYQQRSELPYPYYDLLEKMNLLGNISEIHSDFFNNIRKIIGGQLVFKIEESSFVFQKDDGSEVKAFNIATGIKSLGLIQLLLNSGTINQKNILIIDEPEVHLHPKWETQYAKLIVSLSKSGIPIIISSHSPYFLKALTYYIKEYDASEITKVYYGEKNTDTSNSIFHDVTENLEPIFKKLAEPMQELL